MSASAQRYRYDDRRMREMALDSFCWALRSDRMIAITGAMSDQALGYYNWKEFSKKLAEQADKALEWVEQERKRRIGAYGIDLFDVHNPHFQAIKNEIDKTTKALKAKLPRDKMPMDNRVAFAVLRDLFRQIRLPPAPPGDEDAHVDAVTGPGRRTPEDDFAARVAALFMKREEGVDAGPAAIRPLLEGLGISRIATLNYDLELERALMLRPDERKRAGEPGSGGGTPPPAGFMHWVGKPGEGRPVTRDHTGRMSRMMGDGLLVESDWLNRARPDRLVEFAVGSSEVDRHILHLHGRADEPGSMVVDIRDYDRHYRRDDLYRNPFEHGLRVLLAGNPVLFVGLGMSEVEINDKLQYFVSNAPRRRMAPAFLIWGTLGEDPQRVDQWMHQMRIDYLVRLGVHVIFDRDLLDSKGDWLQPERGASTYIEHLSLPKFAELDAAYRREYAACDIEKGKRTAA